MGPRRGYELVLYAVKGDRNVNAIVSDVFTADTDENLGHAAQKPVSAYAELLRRSVAAGDLVVDPFCGSGPIFPAAHSLKCKAIGIELDPAFHGICLERLQALKEAK
jgi:DNA modification methylase